jgi:hypothetical protein
MRVELLTPRDADWARMLADTPHDFYHLPAYVEAEAAAGGEACALYVEENGARLLVPFVRQALAGAPGRSDLTSPYGYPGPLLDSPNDPGFATRALQHAVTLLREWGVVALFGRLHPLLQAPLDALGAVGKVVEHGPTVSIDLRLEPKRVWSDMRKGHRYAIRRAEREGFVAAQDGSWQRLEDFARLYTATMQRLGASAYYFFSDGYFARLRQALGGCLSLWVVEKDGQLACASLFTEVSGIVQYHLSASDPAFSKHEPNKLLINAVRVWAQTRGNTDLHLGGGVGGAPDSLFFFKAGFSERQHLFRSWRVVIDERTYAELSRARDADADVSQHVGFFPAYRKSASAVRVG